MVAGVSNSQPAAGFDSPFGELTLAAMTDTREQLVDKRIVERNIRKGLLSNQDFETYLERLEDLQGRFEMIRIETGDTRTDDLRE